MSPRAGLALAAAAAALAPSPALAADWIMLRDLITLTRIDFIDKDSLRFENGEAEAMLYAVFIDDAPSGMAAMEVRYRFDCARPRGRMLWGRTFDGNQRVRSEGPINEDWEDIPATNFLTVVRPYACSNGASPTGTSMGSAHPFAAARTALRESRSARR